VHTLITFCANTFDKKNWKVKPTLLSQRPQRHTPNTSTWAISIKNIPNSLRYEFSHLPGNNHAHPPIITHTQQNEPPATKRTRFSTTPLWLHETNTPPNVTLNPPTSPTARPATPTFDDYAPSPAHDHVRLAPTPIAPIPRPFSPLDMHPHRPHLTSPQPPHLAPPPSLAPPVLKPTRPDSPPPASCQPQDATRRDNTTEDGITATPTDTSTPPLKRPQAAVPTPHRYDLPEDWDSKSKRAKKSWYLSHT